MVTRIDQLSEILEGVATAVESVEPARDTGRTNEFEFWSGASGNCYVHSVFSLIECPELGQVNFMLVSVDDAGHRKVAHVGTTASTSSTLNRAIVRQLGARLGASEVHVHFLGRDDRQRTIIAFDLDTVWGAGHDGQPRH